MHLRLDQILVVFQWLETLLNWIGANPVECLGTVTGVSGALMLAIKSRFSAWAWLIWIVSNVAWTYYAFSLTPLGYGLIVQQVVFGAINIIGAWNWMRPINTSKISKGLPATD